MKKRHFTHRTCVATANEVDAIGAAADGIMRIIVEITQMGNAEK